MDPSLTVMGGAGVMIYIPACHVLNLCIGYESARFCVRVASIGQSFKMTEAC